MAVEYINFYENIMEANLRLQHSVVLYEDKPYYIWCITNHKSDGIFRVYMEPLNHPDGNVCNRVGPTPYDHVDYVFRGEEMDKFMIKHPDSNLLRKHMNSPGFKKFRPFPLGMANSKGKAYFVERTPQRHTQQGLTEQHIQLHQVSIEPKGAVSRSAVPIFSAALSDTITGEYPSFKDCVINLRDPTVTNEAVGFDRNFALVRGPVGSLFLSYKTDIIGVLPNGDESSLRILKKFEHTKEVVALTSAFNHIEIR